MSGWNIGVGHWDGTIAPEVGALFNYQGRGYRLTAYLKRMAPPEPPAGERDPLRDLLTQILYDTQQKCGPDNERLVFCDRLEAEYACGAGVAGCIARLTDIEVTGMVDWDEPLMQQAREHAQSLISLEVH